MTAGSNRLQCRAIAGLNRAAMLALAVVVLCVPAIVRGQQTQAAGASTSPAGADVEAQIEKVMAGLHTMSSAEILAKLDPLLKGDLSAVLTSVKVSGFNALAAAHERLAQDARLNRLDPGAERRAQEQLDQAAAAYVSGGKAAGADRDFATADQMYTRALSFRPNMPEALLGQARAYAQMPNKSFQALESYQQYLSATKQATGAVYEPQLYVEMGRVYASANLWNQALKSYRQALANGLDNDEVAALLASCYMALGQADEAFKQADKAITKKADQPAYYRLYAELLMQRNEFTKASERAAAGVKVARERLVRAPDDQTTLAILSDCYASYVRALDKMVHRNVEDLQSRLALVQALQEQSDVTQILSLHRALGVLRAAPEKDRISVPVLEQQIRLQRLVRHSGLRTTCERLLSIEPDNKLAREAIASLDATQPAAENSPAK